MSGVSRASKRTRRARALARGRRSKGTPASRVCDSPGFRAGVLTFQDSLPPFFPVIASVAKQSAFIRLYLFPSPLAGEGEGEGVLGLTDVKAALIYTHGLPCSRELKISCQVRKELIGLLGIPKLIGGDSPVSLLNS